MQTVQSAQTAVLPTTKAEGLLTQAQCLTDATNVSIVDHGSAIRNQLKDQEMDSAKPTETGLKFDTEKPRVDLLDPEWLIGTAQVLTFGAKKYSKKGECLCLVALVKEILKFGPEDFVKVAITQANKILNDIENISEHIEKQTLNVSEITKKTIWLQTLTSSKLNVETILNESTDSTMLDLIESLHKKFVKFVEETINCVLTMTMPQAKLEADFVKDVTLLLASMKEKSGQQKHSNTCQSLVEIRTGAHNWRGGITYSRLIGAALRHIFAILRGEDLDPESGLPHVHHASCCLMFLSAMMSHRKDLDDRWKPDQNWK